MDMQKGDMFYNYLPLKRQVNIIVVDNYKRGQYLYGSHSGILGRMIKSEDLREHLQKHKYKKIGTVKELAGLIKGTHIND